MGGGAPIGGVHERHTEGEYSIIPRLPIRVEVDKTGACTIKQYTSLPLGRSVYPFIYYLHYLFTYCRLLAILLVYYLVRKMK